MSKIEKKGCPTHYTNKVLDYTPAEYIVAARETYILFYQTNPDTGKRVRFRPTFNLNRIKDSAIRAKRGEMICKKVNKLLPSGYPFVSELEIKKQISVKPEQIETREALLQSVDFKGLVVKNKKTISTYKSQVLLFADWCDENGLSENIHSIKPSHVHRYIDYIQEARDLKNRTVNNYVTMLKTLNFELLKRDITLINPFSKFPKLQEDEQIRREFNDYERKVVANYIMENNKYLWLAILLEFYCCLRPKDIRFMKFGDIKLKQQTIITYSENTKNKKTQHVTIPDILLEYLLQIPEFERFPSNWYIFGKGLQPGTIPVGTNTLNYKHSIVLEKLKETGDLMDTTGLSLYSWKYSGNQMLFDSNISLLDIKKQNRHSSITTTEVYARRQSPVIQSVKVLRHDIRK